jgi:hypothetical protein
MGNARRLMGMLLQRNVPFGEVWEQTGETALNMAVTYDDVEVRGPCTGVLFPPRCCLLARVYGPGVWGLW